MAFITTPDLNAQNCWSPLGAGVGMGYANQMANYNGTLILSGEFDSAGGIPASNIAAWNGSSWVSLGTGIKIDTANSVQIYTSSMVIYNGELYVAGQFDSAGGMPVHNIAKWDGSSWSSVGSGIPGASFTIQAMAVYNGALYVGGRFDTAGGVVAHHIAKWDGNQWLAVSGGVQASSNQNNIYCLAAHNGLLYVGGTFDSAGNIQAVNIAAWNDTAWVALGNGVGAANVSAQVTSLAFYQGNLYTAVLGFSSHYTDSLAMWNGTIWTSLCGVGATNYNIGVDVLFAFDSSLIVGGGFDSIGGIAANNLAQWNGTIWSAVGGGVNGPVYYPQVNALDIYNGHLYASGQFTQAGTTPANSIAEYTCATDGINHIAATNNATVYPNPSTGIVNISLENLQDGASVRIYDLLGQPVYRSTISSTYTEINLSTAPPGTYLYRISGTDGTNISSGAFIIR